MSDDTVSVPGTAVWDRRDGFTNGTDSVVPYTYQVTCTVTSSLSKMNEIAKENSTSNSIGVSVSAGAQMKIFSSSVTSDYSWTESSLTRTTESTETTETTSVSTTKKVGPTNVEPGKSMYVYCKVLDFGGYSYDSTDTLVTSDPTPPVLSEDLTLDIPVTDNTKFLERIDVENLGSFQQSTDWMQVNGKEMETSDNVNDINKGFQGDFVYLKPVWTTDRSKAADNIKFYIEDDFPQWAKDRGLKDLATGAGGDFRFIEALNEGSNKKIVQTKLFDTQLARTPDTWTDFTIDINKGRGGRYLYCVWRSVEL